MLLSHQKVFFMDQFFWRGASSVSSAASLYDFKVLADEIGDVLVDAAITALRVLFQCVREVYREANEYLADSSFVFAHGGHPSKR
jgi:hypothetical protein